MSCSRSPRFPCNICVCACAFPNSILQFSSSPVLQLSYSQHSLGRTQNPPRMSESCDLDSGERKDLTEPTKNKHVFQANCNGHDCSREICAVRALKEKLIIFDSEPEICGRIFVGCSGKDVYFV